MGNGTLSAGEKGIRPFSQMSDGAKKWQSFYHDAVTLAHFLQRHGFDPAEAQYIKPHEIHMMMVAQKLFTFNEKLVFDVAVELLKERHAWSYPTEF